MEKPKNLRYDRKKEETGVGKSESTKQSETAIADKGQDVSVSDSLFGVCPAGFGGR